MRKHSLIVLSVASAFVLMTGCGSDFPPVSGKVTANGQPVEGVRVIFMPVSTSENPFPGPYSEGTTNEDGVFSLVTRNGDAGCTGGKNNVELYSVKNLELDFLESKIAMEFATSGGDKNHPAWKRAIELKSKIDSLKSMSTGDRMTPAVKTTFTVTDAGTDSANFELTDFVEPSSTKN